MSIRPLSLRNTTAPVQNSAPTNSIAVGEPAPGQTSRIGSSRFPDIFVGGNTQTGRPTSPQTEPNGQPQKKNILDFLSRLGKLFGGSFSKGLNRVVKMMMSMFSPKPLLPPPNTLAGG